MVAAKELGDHLLSVRFIVLLIVLGLAAAIPLYFAADQIRAVAPQASGAAAVFLALFTLGSQDIAILRVDAFVGIVAPLLGLAFAFDAVNGERSEGTLPRLLAQPIHRDDVINGKFAAGMAVIGLVLVSVVVLHRRLRHASPRDRARTGTEVLRLVSWLIVTFLYVGLWLAFGLLLSVVVRRAATAALIGFGVWLLVTVFGELITTLISGLLAPAAGASTDTILGSFQLQQFITRLLPSTLYREIGSSCSTRRSPRSALRPRSARSSRPSSRSRRSCRSTRACCSSGRRSSPWSPWRSSASPRAYIAFMRQEVRASRACGAPCPICPST